MTQFNHKVEDPSKYAYQIATRRMEEFKEHSSQQNDKDSDKKSSQNEVKQKPQKAASK